MVYDITFPAPEVSSLAECQSRCLYVANCAYLTYEPDAYGAPDGGGACNMYYGEIGELFYDGMGWDIFSTWQFECLV